MNNAPSFLERARKAVVAFIGTNSATALVVFEAVGDADFSTVEGIIAFVIANLINFGVYEVRNEGQ